MQLAESYPIFVNFGGPPHYLGLLKVHQKMPRLAERGKNNAGFCVLFEKSTPPPVVTNISSIRKNEDIHNEDRMKCADRRRAVACGQAGVVIDCQQSSALENNP